MLNFSSPIIVAAAFFLAAVDARQVYDVTNYGARADAGSGTDSTGAFSDAWRGACGDPQPSTVYVPYGSFYLRNVAFDGPCKSNDVLVRIDGTLVAPSDYSVVGDAGSWITFHAVDGVRISGGRLDGQGAGLWGCKTAGTGSCPVGSTNLLITNSNNVAIDGLTSVNSQMFHVVVNECQNVNLQNVAVSAPATSPNTDGIHLGKSTSVSILNSTISTGDDCISMGPGTRNVWIEDVACGPGHGISIGSLGWNFDEPGVENVTVKTVKLAGTTNGLRIKTWARPSSGFVRQVSFRHVVMDGVQNPIIIDQNYCPEGRGCPGQASGITVSDVTYSDVRGTSQSEVAVRFDCSAANPCTGVKMQDVALTYAGGDGKTAVAACTHVRGSSAGVVTPVVIFS